MTVADLLNASRAAHRRYRQQAGRISDKGTVSQAPNPLAGGDGLRDALKLRTEAHQLDPEHTDPAWQIDAHAMNGSSHDALMDFYVRALSR